MSRLSREDLDHILCLQFTLAWAGEAPEDDDERLRWWQTDLLHPDAGMALFNQLFPKTAPWAALCCSREAARRTDLKVRKGAADAGGFLSLFALGFAVDEQLDERIAELRRTGKSPNEALPGLFPMTLPLDKDALTRWLSRAEVRAVPSPNGQRLTGTHPASLSQTVDHLASEIRALPEVWMAPHYRLRA